MSFNDFFLQHDVSEKLLDVLQTVKTFIKTWVSTICLDLFIRMLRVYTVFEEFCLHTFYYIIKTYRYQKNVIN